MVRTCNFTFLHVRELSLAAGWPFGRSRVFVYAISFSDELV